MDLLDSNHLVSGSPTFFPALLAHVRELAPPSLPVDPVVFQSILLCLVSGEKHLLLRSPAKDVRLVVKLAFLTLSSIFGFPTHKLKVRPPSSSPIHTSGAPFLRSLFLPWTAPVESQDETHSSKNTISSRNRTRNNATWARALSKKPRRSQSELIGSTTSSNPFGDDGFSSASSSMINPFGTVTRPAKARVPLPHAFSDPTPLRPRSDRAPALQPRALVISGLENATLPSQRALSRALAEKRVILEDEDGDEDYDEVWNLPDGFIMVYVCPLDARERPPIHKTLLDKFAMSATVSPHHSVRALLASPSRNSGSYRNSPALHTAPLPQSQSTPTSSPNVLAQPLPLPHHTHSLPPLHHHVHHSLLPQALVPPALLNDLRASYHRTYLSPLLSLYASDLFSAARHHSQLDAMLLTAKSMNDVLDLARAGRVIGGDLTGIELVREDAAFAAKVRSNGHGNENGLTKPEHPESPITPGPVANTGLAHHYQPIEVVVEEADGESTTPRRGSRAAAEKQETQPEVLEVSEADVARIAPRVMTHRLRVRDGPESEVLAAARYPAVEDESSASKDLNRITIKEILVRILAEV
ncbi:hypothetical protein MSAN_00059100 [Mycena sanguinolenta]|uniref:Uncharacterized protein n=1 Tax=Mycena sanguinolenta TaxID=230812 RepID=A0A8H7DJE3_9AGAR|nr:hypothetical protein MSAN_00059100 [Mycena sanguinolenta]